MRKAPYLLAVAAISGLALMATPSSASPLASGLESGSAVLPALNEGLLQKVQAWSCQEKYRDMTVEQRRFCRGYYYDYGPRYGYGYRGYGYPYGGYGYPYGFGLGIPFFGFGFDDDHHHGWRRHGHHGKWRRHHGGHHKWRRRHY